MFSPKSCLLVLHAFFPLAPPVAFPQTFGGCCGQAEAMYFLSSGVLGPRENQTSLLRGAGIFNPIGNYH